MYIDLAKISFPVYLLKEKPVEEGKKLFYINRKDEEVYLDDKGIEGSSLSKRRLSLLKEGKQVYSLNIAIFFIKDIIKLAKPGVYFIDSKGFLFSYTKSKFVNLEFKPITKVIPLEKGGAVIEVDNEAPRYKVLFAPAPEETFAGLLKIKPCAYVLYGLYKQKLKKTRRKV